jgi:magnesium chelatase family protein
VKGQENINRALEIAAARGHNAILIGPPGAGKTMLAKRLPTILPPVIKARKIQAERYQSCHGIYCNAQMSSKMLKEICIINTAGQNLLKVAMEKLNLSARAYDRILKVSRTVADLSQSEDIKIEHLAEAIRYRSLDREGWAG